MGEIRYMLKEVFSLIDIEVALEKSEVGSWNQEVSLVPKVKPKIILTSIRLQILLSCHNRV